MSPVGRISSGADTDIEFCDDNANKYSYAYATFKDPTNNTSSHISFHMLVVVNSTMYADYIVHMYQYQYKLSNTTIRAISARNESVFNFSNKKFIFDYKSGTDHNLKIGFDMSTVSTDESLFYANIYIYNVFSKLSTTSDILIQTAAKSTNSNPYSSNKLTLTPITT